MPDLPHGWRMRNSSGEKLGPPLPSDHEDATAQFADGSDSGGESIDALDIKPDSEGWNDVDENDDVEELKIQCLLCPADFPAATLVIDHCKNAHQFDFVALQTKHNVDFYNSIKMVNYIRTEVRRGNEPDMSDSALWADDKFLQPVLEDDALLFTLDDIDERPVAVDDAGRQGEESKAEAEAEAEAGIEKKA